MHDVELQHIPTIQVSSAIAGAFIASEIIFFLQGKSQIKNKILQYSAEYHRCSVFDVPQNEKCFLHRDAVLTIVDSNLSNTATIDDLLRYSKSAVNEECLFRLEDEFIFSMDCEGCGKKIPINKFRSDVYDKQRWCSQCLDEGKYEEIPISKEWRVIREANLLNKKHAEYLQMRLSEFSVKARDLIRVDLLNDLTRSYLVKIN